MKLTVIIIFHDVYKSNPTMLYTINLYNALCQLHPNKTGGKKNRLKSQTGKKIFNYCIKNFNNQEDISETGIQTDWEES